MKFPDNFDEESKALQEIFKKVDDSDYVNNFVEGKVNLEKLLKGSELQKYALYKLVRSSLFISPALSMKLIRQGY